MSEVDKEEKGIIRVKKGTIVLEMDKKDLISVDQTSDGMVFNLKGGLQLYDVDVYMELATKNLIISGSKIPKGNLTIDLNNHKQPAVVEL